jgi:hypothetical protein
MIVGHCGTCKFGERIDLGEDGEMVMCHRFPPQMIVHEGDASAWFPEMEPDDWCGEYRWEPGAVTDN